MKSGYNTALNNINQNNNNNLAIDELSEMIDFRNPSYSYLNKFRAAILSQTDLSLELDSLYPILKNDVYIQFIQNLIYFAYHNIDASTSNYPQALTTHIIEILSDKCQEDFTIWVDPKEKYTILNVLCTNGDLHNIKLLMNFLKNKYYYNPMMIFNILMHPDKNGNSSIQSACGNNFSEIVKYLIEFTSDIFGDDSEAIKILHYSTDKLGNNLLNRACSNTNFDLVGYLLFNFLKYCNNDYRSAEFKTYFIGRNNSDWTNLNLICKNDNFSIAEFFIAIAGEIYRGESTEVFMNYINQTGNGNFTPLINACRNGNFEISELLIRAAKNATLNDIESFKKFINFKNDHGYSSLDSAIIGNHDACITLLLNHGAETKNTLNSQITFSNHQNYQQKVKLFVPTLNTFRNERKVTMLDDNNFSINLKF